MKSWDRLELLAAFMVLALWGVSAQAVSVLKEDGGPPWQVYDGDMRFTPALPDKVSVYGVLTYQRGSGNFDMFKITAKFPHARYLGWSIADFESGDTGTGANQKIYDQELIPDSGPNPFEPNGQRDPGGEPSYTLWVVKDGFSPPGGSVGKNVIVMDSNCNYSPVCA